MLNRVKTTKILTLLEKGQQFSGGFLSLSSADINNFSDLRIYSTTFLPSLILTFLAGLPYDELKPICKKICKFLISNKNESGSLNYWQRNSQNYREMPYPDDLDDTFTALAAIKLFDSKLIGGNTLAEAANILIATETKEGGPYRTWLVDPKKADKIWLDVDLAVNSNIAYFLHLVDIRIESIEKLVEKAIVNQNIYSPYYPSSLHVVFFISRFYKGKYTDRLIRYILSEYKNRELNAFELCLAAQALLNFDSYFEEIFSKVKALKILEIFKPFPYSIDPSINQRKYYAGSPELTAAIYLNTTYRLSTIHQSDTCPKDDLEETNIIKDVVRIFNTDLQTFAPSFKQIGKDTIKKILSHSSGEEIILLSFYTKSLLPKEKLYKLEPDTILFLGLANLYGWIAYTIYDDFIDEEGEPFKLPFANYCLRRMTAIYEKLSPDHFYEKLISIQDQTNLFEVENLRFKGKDFKKASTPRLTQGFLYRKSIGHMIGPLLLFQIAGFGKDSHEYKSLEKFLKNYLAARQLADDMHDWQEDLKRGQLNYVSVDIFNNYRGKNDSEKFNEYYWNKLVSSHIAIGKKLLVNAQASIGRFSGRQTYLKLISDLSSVYQKTDFERKNVDLFMKKISI